MFKNILWVFDEYDDKVVYGSSNKIIVQNIFDDHKDYREINMFKHSLSSSTDSILDVNFVNKGTSLVVTYILKEYDGEVTEVI